MDTLPEIPGYNIKRMIGQGGMATVYLAEQVALHRLVALKIMSPALAADDTFTSRFLKEGATSANLFHPKIIKVFNSGVHDHHYYMAMEYLNGGTLKEKIGSGLPLKTALRILKDMADALRYAHSRDVVHRDIKSQNILLYEDGTPVLSDFGVAKALGSNTALTRTGIAVGSPGYMSPEQLRGEPIDGRTDIYALGILFYEMLTGELPYQATDQFAVAFKHIYDPIPTLPPKYAAFQPILNMTLAKAPEDRVPNADALLEQIAQAEDNYEASLSGETHTLPTGQYPSPTLRRVFKAAVAAIVVAAIGIGAWYYQQRRSALSEESQQLYSLAIEQRDAGNYRASLDAIAKALLIEPDAKSLITLHREVLSHLAEQQRGAALAQELLAKARQARQAGELQQSLDLVRQGLTHDAQSPELNALLQTLQTALEQRQEQFQALLDEAEQLRQQKNHPQSLAKLEEASALKPIGPELTRLKNLQEQIKTEQLIAQQAAQLEQQLQTITAEAQTLFEQNHWQASIDKINEGLALSPQSSDLIALKQQAEARLAEWQDQQEKDRLKQNQLAELLQKAQDAMDKGDLQTSLKLIEQGLHIDAQAAELLSLHATVQSAIQQRQENIAQLLQDARDLQSAGNYQQSLSKLDEALALKPSDPMLTQLRDAREQVESEQNAARHKAEIQQQLRDIKTQALALREQGQLLQSLATLNEGLAIRADEPELSALHQQVNEQYAQYEQAFVQARQAQQDGKLEQSLSFIEQGLAIVPNSNELLRMRDLTQAAIELRRQTIARLIQEAEQLREERDYRTSLSKIDQALGLNPTEPERANLQALRQQISAQQDKDSQLADLLADLLARARQTYQEAQYEQSLALIEQGLKLAPDHAELQRLQAEVKQAQLAKIEQDRIDQQATQTSAEAQQIQDLLALAEQQIEGNFLTTPEGNNALETYQKVFAIDPDNKQAKQGLIAIADGYLRLAQARKNRKNYRSSLRYIDLGLSIASEHSELLALRSEVSTLQEQQRQAEAERKEREWQAKLDAERKERERQAKLEAERKERNQQTDADRRQKERQAKLEAERKERERQAKLEAERKERERQAKLEAERKEREQQAKLEAEAEAASRPANNQKKASLNAQLSKLQNELATVQHQRNAKNCDYWESMYGLSDMTTRQKGCPRYNSQIDALKQEISQVKRQLASLN